MCNIISSSYFSFFCIVCLFIYLCCKALFLPSSIQIKSSSSSTLYLSIHLPSIHPSMHVSTFQLLTQYSARIRSVWSLSRQTAQDRSRYLNQLKYSGTEGGACKGLYSAFLPDTSRPSSLKSCVPAVIGFGYELPSP